MLTYPNPKLMGAVTAHFRGRLHSLDAALALAIVAHLRDDATSGDPSVERLSDIVGMKRRAVASAVARLRAERVIETSSRRGRGMSSVYRIGDALRPGTKRDGVRGDAVHPETVQPTATNDAAHRHKRCSQTARNGAARRTQ